MAQESTDPSALDISEELGALTEELVSDEPAAVAFLGRLFAQPVAQWHPVRALVADLGEVATKVGLTEDGYKITLLSMWNPCPPSSEGDSWAVVVFYSPEWNGVANTILVDRKEVALHRN